MKRSVRGGMIIIHKVGGTQLVSRPLLETGASERQAARAVPVARSSLSILVVGGKERNCVQSIHKEEVKLQCKNTALIYEHELIPSFGFNT